MSLKQIVVWFSFILSIQIRISNSFALNWTLESMSKPHREIPSITIATTDEWNAPCAHAKKPLIAFRKLLKLLSNQRTRIMSNDLLLL